MEFAEPMRRPGREVAVVGAGVAGTSVFLHLIQALGRLRDRPVRAVTLVDPHPVGWGLAFGDSDTLLLCNSAAEVNSLLADRPADFVGYLRGRGWAGDPRDCVPRARMAEYCHDRYAEARAAATALGVEVRHARATAESVGTAGDGRRLLRLSTGRELPADDVVLCTGVHRPRVPAGFAEFTRHPRYLDGPYPAARLRREVRPDSRVLVLGTRQSAVDAALLLCRDGHRATMTSPSGRLPAVRVSLGAPAGDLPPVRAVAALDPADPLLAERLTRRVVEAVRLLDDRPLRRQTSRATDPVRRLREETALVEAGACAWSGVVMAVMEAAIALGPGLTAERRAGLLARFDWFTARYVTAMTVVNARRLLAHFATGALALAGSYPHTVAFADGAWRVSWPGSGAPDRFDHVVNATGFELPVLHHSPDGRTLHLTGPPEGATAVDRLEADLRVRQWPGAPPEPVWVAGVGTHPRVPFSNHLRNVVRQARQVAHDVADAGRGVREPPTGAPHP
ncbi:FAD/NAD(P)-binding protein [Streptomyces cinnamoneus]|nr:FAD/NAD(P)-binding protein [Streptomyces cinnamoneus]